MVVILKNGFVTDSIVTNPTSNNYATTQNSHHSNSQPDNQRCNFTDPNSNLRCNALTESKKKSDRANFCIKHLRLLTNWKRNAILRKRVNRPSSVPRSLNLDDYHDAEDFRKPLDLTNVPAELAEISSEENEILNHAGIYTTEEVVRITLEKMIKLRSKYVEYLNVLNRRIENGERLASRTITDDPNRDLQSGSMITNNRRKEAIRALTSYGRISRRDKLLRKYLTNEKSTQHETQHPCTFAQGEGTKCQNESLINSKYCISHLLQDPEQVLYAQCSQEGCSEMIFGVLEKCVSHIK